MLEEIIRVDQAGELGANYIYAGQLAVLSRTGDKRVADLIQVSVLLSSSLCRRKKAHLSKM